MRAQSYLFVESESFFSNGQSRLYFVQFSKGLLGETFRHVKTIQKYELKTNHNYLETIKIYIPFAIIMQMFFTPLGKGVMHLTNTLFGSKSSVASSPQSQTNLG